MSEYLFKKHLILIVLLMLKILFAKKTKQNNLNFLKTKYPNIKNARKDWHQ
jgi:hypothetical protein